jgi:hypothetical protein
MGKLPLILVLFTLLCPSLQAAQKYKLRRGFFTLGTLTENFGFAQVDTSGGTETFDFNPYLATGFEFSWKRKWFLVGELGLTLPRTIDDGAASLMIYQARVDAATRRYKGKLKLSVGTSLVFRTYKGNGGTTTLDNGGTPQTFYRPEETRTAINNTLDFGAEFHFSKKNSAKFQVFTYSILDPDQTQFSYILSWNWYWENKKIRWDQ